MTVERFETSYDLWLIWKPDTDIKYCDNDLCSMVFNFRTGLCRRLPRNPDWCFSWWEDEQSLTRSDPFSLLILLLSWSLMQQNINNVCPFLLMYRNNVWWEGALICTVVSAWDVCSQQHLRNLVTGSAQSKTAFMFMFFFNNLWLHFSNPICVGSLGRPDLLRIFGQLPRPDLLESDHLIKVFSRFWRCPTLIFHRWT